MLTWRLKSRALWIEQGDANTKFFHSFASARLNNNTIWELSDGAGNSASSMDQLKLLGEEHFSSLFMDDGKTLKSDQLHVIKHLPTFLTTEDSTIMDAEVTTMKIETTLKRFKKDRSLGPGGWLV